MKLKYLLLLAASCGTLIATAQAKKKTTVSKPAITKNLSNFKLVEAYTQRTLAGIPGEPPETEHHFLIVWQGTRYPETFFWRGDGGWLTCKMEKARKSPRNKKGGDYATEFVSGDQVHRGDTLLLTPITGGRFPIPDEIPEKAKNTLFYKVRGSAWLFFPVKKITRKADAVRM